MSDNSLFISGTVDRYFGDALNNIDRYKDLWLLHVDEYGCLEEDCGGQVQLIEGEPYFSNMMHSGAMWYYQNPTADGGIIKQTLLPSGPTSYMARTDQFLDLRTDFIFEDINNFVFHISDDHRQYYYLTEGDTVLLYDFSLELGDVFESPYTPHKLTVIETDTMRSVSYTHLTLPTICSV